MHRLLTSFSSFLKASWQHVVRFALMFGLVGGIGYIIDVSIFNVLLIYGTQSDSPEFIFTPVGAKISSSAVAILFNWIGNRYWVFRANRRKEVFREFIEFATVAFAGTLISLVVLWFSHDVLRLTSLLADNIAGNVIGLGLGTVFRFVLYRYWVFAHHRGEKIAEAKNKTELAELAIFVEPK